MGWRGSMAGEVQEFEEKNWKRLSWNFLQFDARTRSSCFQYSRFMRAPGIEALEWEKSEDGLTRDEGALVRWPSSLYYAVDFGM